jgi:hypothetical protein
MKRPRTAVSICVRAALLGLLQSLVFGQKQGAGIEEAIQQPQPYVAAGQREDRLMLSPLESHNSSPTRGRRALRKLDSSLAGIDGSGHPLVSSRANTRAV